ncbi:MAG: bifunctional adenosylcobinamide kinase/adenosylcobinamide-phosphate guanylyltransferase [Nitrospirae bacterium]|nr:bifunctional adenosylcobinamide kinase/adenosylcobinamide-phosphate guanylyltransferase [Nitrospirota bacterium]
MSDRTGTITFVIGGARSGKSSFALDRASEYEGQKVFIATAQAFDSEMTKRIQKHRQERGGDWETVEAPLAITGVLKDKSGKCGVIVIDCLTLWLSNLLLAGMDVEMETGSFISSLSTVNCPRVFIVSNEVGMGIVPENELARRFRDIAGRLNQKTAALADEVYMVTAGIPVKIK